MRAVEEWIGKTPDTPIPHRVRLRVWERGMGHCEECGRKIMTGETWDIDHRKPLILGGGNRETNLRVICLWCHRSKTRTEMAAKSKGYRVAKKHVGLKKKSRSFATNRDQPFKKKISGRVERRKAVHGARTEAPARAAWEASTVPLAHSTSPWRDARIETNRLSIERMLWPDKDHLAALNDKEHMKYSEQRRYTHTIATQQAAIDASIKSEDTPFPRLMFYILVKSPGGNGVRKVAGSMSVDLDLPNNRADMGIMILPNYTKQGIGLEAWIAMKNYWLNSAQVMKVEAGFMWSNDAMRKLCIYSSMSFEGQRSNHFRITEDGLRESVVYHGAMK